MPISEEQLKEAGFRQFPPSEKPSSYASRVYELIVRDNKDGKRYFVIAYVYDPIPDSPRQQITIMFEVLFYLSEGLFYLSGEDGPWFSVTLNDANTLDSVLVFFARVYDRMGCCLDRHNN